MIGPKAASLCTLCRSGTQVPPCFFVTTTAFGEHLEANGLRPQIAARRDKVPAAIEEVRQLITRAPLRDSLREQVATAYGQLGTGVVAVRSSATTEELTRMVTQTLPESMKDGALLYFWQGAVAPGVLGKICRNSLGDQDQGLGYRLLAA